MTQFKIRDHEGEKPVEFWLELDEWKNKVLLKVSDKNGYETYLLSFYPDTGLMRRWHHESEIEGLQLDEKGRIKLEEDY